MLEKIMICEKQALYYYHDVMERPVKPFSGRSRRTALLAIDLLDDNNYKLVRKRFEGTVNNILAVVTPDLSILDKQNTLIGVARVKIRSNLRIYSSDYAPLFLAGLLSGQDLLYMIVIAAKEPKSIIHAIKQLAGKGPQPVETNTYKIQTKIYDPAVAEQLIERAISLIEGRIQPRPPRAKGVCRYCPYRTRCEMHS